MTKALYGDGINDDTEAIQELLDSGRAEISLEEPQKFYKISRPLAIHTRQRLKLPRYAEIRLADGSDCVMIKNAEPDAKDISLEGGIWNLNNLGQSRNPFFFKDTKNPDYHGYIMLFERVKGLQIRNLTLKDPVTFAVTLDFVSYFTVENIVFDFNYGNPWAVNMDGIHLDGNCHFGAIRNLKGACYDDLVALNADEGSDGPITNIDIDGIYCEDCHSAVRLLTVKNPVESIHIHNVFGTFFQYCIGITKFYKGEETGWYDALTFDNIHASKAERLSVYQKDGSFEYPLIWVEKELKIMNLHISDLYRREINTPVATIQIEKSARVEALTLNNIDTKNYTGRPMPLLNNMGEIVTLKADMLDAHGDELFSGDGSVENDIVSRKIN